MKCLDFREIIDSYLSDELLTETNHEVLRHLEECANCRDFIESRRTLRAHLKAAIINAPELQISENFYNNLHTRLKTASKTDETAEKAFRTRTFPQLAFAMSIIFAVGFGFWFFQTRDTPSFSSDTARLDGKIKEISLADFAVGDHRNCAVKYNLTEEPIDIDLSEVKYTDLRQGILVPLQNSAQEYKFLESHTCKYNGHQFTHIVFRHQGRTVSVLTTDLQNYPALKTEEITANFSNNYQIARFDVNDKAIFVVSDLPERENTATAKILETPLTRQLTSTARAQTNLLDKISYSYSQTVFINH